MKSKKLSAVVLRSLIVVGLSLPVMAQTTTQSDLATQDSAPATSQTTTTTTTTQGSRAANAQDSNTPAPIAQDSVAPETNAPMTKGEMKEQKKQQKQQEKSANANAAAEKQHAKAQKNEAKATKDEAKALKDEHKSTDAAEKANAPQ